MFGGNVTIYRLLVALMVISGCTLKRPSVQSSEVAESEMVTPQPEARVLGNHDGVVFSVDVCPGGQTAISACSAGTVKVWDLRGHSEVLSLPSCLTPGVQCAAVSPDGRSFVAVGHNSGLHDQKIKLCSIETGEEIVRLEGSDESYQQAAFSPDGRQLVAVDTVRGGVIGMWNPSTGERLRTFRPGGRCALGCVAFDPKGTRFVAADTIYDAATGDRVRALQKAGSVRCPMSVTFDGDGRRIACGYHDGTIGIWDAERGVELVSLEGHMGWVYSVDFDDEGNRLASAGKDGVINVWDTRTGRRLLKVCELPEYVFAVRFGLDGSRLVSGHRDGTVRIWNIGVLQSASGSARSRPRGR